MPDERTVGMRLAALSVDLDEIDCYAAIYGLPAPMGDGPGPIYRHAIPRFESLLAELAIPCTFFAIGRDLAREANRPIIARLHAAGHEIANHTLDHRYDFSRLSRAQIARQIDGGGDLIEAATGQRPVGFRAPGYTISDDVFDTLRVSGYTYDSSVFPCPAYYGAKTAAIGAIGLRAQLGRGRPSHSVVDTPKVLTASADPYRPGSPYHQAQPTSDNNALVELPIGVTRGARLPYIGTTVVGGSPAFADLLTRQMVGRPFVNLELHGIDLSDARQDGLMEGPDSLGGRLPELKRSAAHKRECLIRAVRRLQAAGYRFVTLAEAAEHF